MAANIFFLLFLIVPVCTGKSPTYEEIPGLSFPKSQLIFNSKFLKTHNLSQFGNAEQYGRLYDMLSKLHGPPASQKEVLSKFKKTAEKIINNPSAYGDGDINLENLASCSEQLLVVTKLAEVAEFNALKMLDSWGKPEGGLLEGNVRWPGHYYECSSAEVEEIEGKWCNTFLGFKYVPHPIGFPIDISIGSCFPSVCSESSVRWILRDVYQNYLLPPILEVTCPVPPTNLSTGTIVGIVVSSILAALAVVGTALDVVLRYDTKADQKNISITAKIMLCFSVISNGEKLISMKKRRGTLPVLDGIRFISTTWVILGHSLNFMIYGLDNAVYMRRVLQSNASVMAIANATYAVDTFFFLSGLLVAYLGIKHLNKSNGYINIPLMYLQRYARLTPVYAYLILFSIGLYKYCGAGPYWQDMANSFHDQCAEDWWANLLYINIFYPSYSTCFGVGWYLSNDMTFYILSPIFLILLYKVRIVGLVTAALLCVSGALTTGLLSYYSNLQPTVIGMMQQLSVFYRFYTSGEIPESIPYDVKFKYDTYYAPWNRIAGYMVGMVTGYVLYTFQCKIKMPKICWIVGWIASTAIGLSIIYALWESVQTRVSISPELAGFYNGASRPVWAMCLAWVVIACSSGYGGPVTKFLDWKIFVPLSRLTYSAYLVHIMVMFWYIGIQEQPLHNLTVNLVYLYLGTLVISFGLAFALALMVEWPFMGLLKLVLPPSKPRTVIPAENGHALKSPDDMQQLNGYVRKSTDSETCQHELDVKDYINKAYEDEKSERIAVNGVPPAHDEKIKDSVTAL